MSWHTDTDDEAVVVTDALGVTYADEYKGTSVSTVLLTTDTGWKLRMYGVQGIVLRGLGGRPTASFIAAPLCDFSSPFVVPYLSATGTLDTQEYIESATWTTPGGFSAIGMFSLEKTVDSVYQTCVPRSLENPAVTWYRLNRVGSTGVRIDVPEGQADVEYKDLHVLKLPNGAGWLMLLARYIALAGSGGFAPTNSLSQIVAWYSNTEDFTGSHVIGPFLLVDGCRCMSDDQGVRLWIGVPAAVVVDAEDGDGKDLLVYYSVDECGIGYRTPRSSSPTSDKGTLRDSVAKMAYDTELTRIGFQPCVAVKRFRLSDLFTQIWSEVARVGSADDPAAARDLTDETTWTPDSAISGDLLGAVRLWFPDSSDSTWLRPFSEDYPLTDLRAGDPVPVTCGGTIDTLSLFMSMIGGESGDIAPAVPAGALSSGQLGSGHGIWRGRALAGGDLYRTGSKRATGFVITTAGLDFLFARQSSSTRVLPDQVAEGTHYTFNLNSGSSYATDVMWIDPDPVQLDDGTWWVGVGGGGDSRTGNYMTAWKGTSEDGCDTASMAFKNASVGLKRSLTGTRSLPTPAVFAEARRSPDLAPSVTRSYSVQTTRLDTTTLPQGDSTPSSGAQPGLRADAFIEKLRSRGTNLGQR